MIAKLLHEGETTTSLKNIIKYNTVAKEHLNSINNPRLLQAISNIGIIDISDEETYQHFMKEFVEEVCLNKSLSNNKRQKKLYAHEVISFEDSDNKNHTQDELIQISIEALNNIYDMNNTPYIIWPQLDSGRLHFHFVRSMYNNKGAYQRVKNSKIKMRQSCEKIERQYHLYLTGNNASSEIRLSNNPMSKIIKNRNLEEAYKHQKKLNEAISNETTSSKIKRKSYNLFMESAFKNESEILEQETYSKIQHSLASIEKINDKIEAFKAALFTHYKTSKDEIVFIDALEKQGITIELLKHSKTGANKGIVFHYKGHSISGSKVSSSMTLGKIKKRYPNFIHSLENPPALHSTKSIKKKLANFNIEQINKYYKQRNSNNNGDILIYFGKKNIEARPHNYNLKLSQNKDSIRFGPATPNSHDLTLSLNVALENDWEGAVLTNSSPDFLKKMMKAAYQKNPKLLFFVQADKHHQLRYADLKDIKPSLTIDDLKTALENKLIAENDIRTVHLDLAMLLKSQATKPDQKGYALAFQRGINLDELDKKTSEELRNFYYYKTFKEASKIPPISGENIKRISNLKIVHEAALNKVPRLPQ